MHYSEEEFKTRFIDIDFDDMLHENNIYITKNEYLDYKNTYLTNTTKNLSEFYKYKCNYDNLNNCYIKKKNKYTFNVMDISEKLRYNDLLKSLIQKQQTKLSQFLQYIDFLNKIVSKKEIVNKTYNKSRMIKTAK